MSNDSLNISLKKSCEVLGYNYSKLIELMPNYGFSIDDSEAHKKNTEAQSISTSFQIPGLVWKNQSPNSLKLFLKTIKLLKVTKDIKTFGCLFNNPCSCLNVELDTTRIVFVLQLFAFLKDAKLIGAHNSNSIYKVLNFHVTSFNETFLLNKKPKERIDAVKKLRCWESSEASFEKQFKNLLFK
jgi:hypothetical protein